MTAAAKLDVLLVERKREVGQPLACAEAVSHEGLSNFLDPDPRYISTRIDTVKFTVATGHSYTYQHTEGIGYVLDRPIFDSYLAQRAVMKGVELCIGTYASGIDMEAERPAMITMITENGEAKVEADFVIAADGVESMIGRMAGVKTMLKLRECDSSLQYRVSGIEVNPRCLEFYVGGEYSPDGYLWVFPKSDNTANIGLGFSPAEGNNRELRVRLDRFLRNRYREYDVEFESCGMVPKFLGLDILGRDNLLLAGDAARTIDSLTGAGINRALHTGQLAARSVIQAAEGGVSREDLVGHYKDAVNKELGRDLHFFKKAHTVFRKFTDEDWESMIRFLEGFLTRQKAGSIDPAALITSALTGAPRLMRLARHLF
jgi:digeranylgeranylglycerophospholipid reductase